MFNPLVRRRPLNSDNTSDIITTFHIGDEHVLGVDIVDIIILIKDECTIQDVSIVITNKSIDRMISLDWHCHTLVSSIPKMNGIKLEME